MTTRPRRGKDGIMANFDKFNLRAAGSPVAGSDEPADGPHPGGAPDGLRDKPETEAAEPSPVAPAKAQRPADRSRRRLAVACGLISAVAVACAGIGGAELASAVQLRQRLEGQTAELVTLTRSVPAGETISASDLAVADVPEAFAPDDAATEAGQVAGRVALVDLSAGNAVSRASLAGSETAGSLPAAVSPGHVGYMLGLSSSAAAASPLLGPGDRVDVLAGTGDSAAVLCSDVRIIATDGTLATTARSADYTNVTLDLTPDQAQALFAATEGGASVHLVALPQRAEGGE